MSRTHSQTTTISPPHPVPPTAQRGHSCLECYKTVKEGNHPKGEIHGIGVSGVVKGTGKEALVMVHVGVNDFGKVGCGELLNKYRKLLREVKESGRKCIVSGVLPRQKVGGMWLSHALGLNDRLSKLCGESGVGFVDEWDRFYGRQELYAMDGVHFSRKGVQELSECLERAVRQYSQGN